MQHKILDEAAKILNSNGVNGELFADDGNGIIGGKDIDYMAQRLNRVCRDLSQWGKKCGLTFNASKTVVIFFFFFFSILLTHEGSHREVYRDFQPSLTSSAGGAKGLSDHRFHAPPAYTAQLLTLH